MSDSTQTNALQSALLSSLMGGTNAGNLDLQGLLAAQAGGATNGLDMASLLAAQGGDSATPDAERLNILMRWLEQRNAATAQSAPAEESPSEAEIELQYLEEQQQAHQRQHEQHELKKVMDALYAELESLRARNDALAAALGACYLCFGEDLACSECGGRGRPGSSRPDVAAFRHYIAPAVHRARMVQAHTAGNSTPRTGTAYQSIGNYQHQPTSTKE